MFKLKFNAQKNRNNLINGTFKSIGDHCSFGELVYIDDASNVTLGNNVKLYRGVYVETNSKEVIIGSDSHFAPYGILYGPLEVGEKCAIAAHVVFASIGEGYQDPDTPFIDQPATNRKIIIEDNVWIGANAVITQGVRIGTGSIIGAGAVVTRDVMPYSVMAGVPARLVRSRK